MGWLTPEEEHSRLTSGLPTHLHHPHTQHEAGATRAIWCWEVSQWQSTGPAFHQALGSNLSTTQKTKAANYIVARWPSGKSSCYESLVASLVLGTVAGES